MTIDRRGLITAGAGLGVIATASAAFSPPSQAKQFSDAKAGKDDRHHALNTTGTLKVKLIKGDHRHQTNILQQAIDKAANHGIVVELPPGRFVIGNIKLRDGTVLLGAHGKTTLVFAGGASFFVGDDLQGVRLTGLNLDGAGLAGELIHLRSCRNIILHDLSLRAANGNGVALTRCSGTISNCDISKVGKAGIFSLDAMGLEISSNQVSGCGNNGILVWRSKAGDDGTIISGNRIFDISAHQGGNGQNGNGINVFRAGAVMVAENHISDCTYSAVRGNSASNIQIIGNSCARIGEVALYAEFGFQGAVISSNLVDTAACGISVTNFNEGGRLAVIQGNLIRNIFRREHEPKDKRGEGIAIEADASVTGNTIEAADTVGLAIGWGRYMRDVVATSNVIRLCPIGIGISSDPEAGGCLVAQNLVSGASAGAIKAMDLGRAHGPELDHGQTLSQRIAINGNLKV